MIDTIVVTGASGFLGEVIVEEAASRWPQARVVALTSPRAAGLDLADSAAPAELARAVTLDRPDQSVVIHAAARVSWHTSNGLADNAAMACHVAQWADRAHVAFAVLVSGVTVYPVRASTDCGTPCAPETLYGLGKWAAEEAWRLILPAADSAVVRLAGLWGWQRRPTLFWNRLLRAAAEGRGAEPLAVTRSHSQRNYLSVYEASRCLLEVAARRMAGLRLAAGRDAIDTGTFVRALEATAAASLPLAWQDDGRQDERLYQPSADLLPWLKSFPDTLAEVWARRPAWVGVAA